MTVTLLTSRPAPTPKQVELLQALGSGATIKSLADEWNISYYTLIDRVRGLRRIARLQTLSGLVYWGLTNLYIDYPQVGLQKLDQKKLDVVHQLALGKSDPAICRALYMSKDGFERRVRDARTKVQAAHRPQLVAICWSEDWIS